jgi:hypothetical protein
MKRSVIGSILHGAYGDLYEQAICLKHFAALHPEVDLKLFAATTTRLNSFLALDLSFASSFELWTEIENRPEIESFYQFQVQDGELNSDVLRKLPTDILARFDRTQNLLPWNYLRDNGLVPTPKQFQLELSESGIADLEKVALSNGISDETWHKPTISFLWRFRQPGRGTISNFGQKSQEEMVRSYSAIFRKIASKFDCHIIICGMNIVTTESNRTLTDNKYPDFGLDLPIERVTYMKGLSWPLELDISSRATVCCGHPSGFTEGLWLKRGRDMVLMDAPPHYLAKIAYRRMPLFDLNKPFNLAMALINRSGDVYRKRIESILTKSTNLPRYSSSE